MNKVVLLAAALAAGYLYLAQTGSPMLRHAGFGASSGGGGSLNPVMGNMAGTVGAGAVKAAGGIGG
jgi:hypothetical protein